MTLIGNFSHHVKFTPSLINFLSPAIALFYSYLRKKGVLVRYFGTQGGQLQSNLRISAGRPQDTEKLINALKEFETANP